LAGLGTSIDIFPSPADPSSSTDRGRLLGDVDFDELASAARFFGDDLETGGAKAAVKVGLGTGILEGDPARALTG